MPFPKRLLTTVYFCTFIACASVGLWDVHSLIKNYIFDNRMTLVGIRSVEDRPFISKTQICLKYNDRALLPVSHERFYRLAVSYWFDRKAFVGLTSDFTEADRQFAEALFELIVPYSYFYYLDEFGHSEVFEETFGLNRSEISRLVDSLLANPNYTIDMDRNWRTIQPYFIQLLGKDAPFRLEYIFSNQDMLCINVPLYLNESSHAHPYRLDYVRDNNESTHGLWNMRTSTATVMVRFISDAYETVIEAGPPAATTTSYVILTNAGVSNMKRLNPCQDEYESDEECQMGKRVETMEQYCKCRQFWYYHQRGSIMSNSKTNSDRPFCTHNQNYHTCFKEADVKARLRIYQNPDYCRSCEFSKTNYHLDTKIQIKTAYELDEFYPRNVLRFVCRDRFYLYFDERPQFVLSQLIAQIGGNLGLYIGFSMMSILHIFTVLCQHCCSNTEAGGGGPDTTRRERHLGRSIQATVRSIWRFLESFAGFDDSGSADGISEQLKDVMRAMQKNNERLEAIERRIAGLEKKEGE